ncbi:MAG: efflux RND transporter periplasmic adaptor subunit [Betaproteobacteria bacterium]|jgi:RND family efflux transporter MFP subunit|nr:MAG: efflux RND transporter periplasmic adaptor subunit [Betaproteobacteria bacterium]
MKNIPLTALVLALSLTACSDPAEQASANAVVRTINAESVLIEPTETASVITTAGSVVAVESVKVASRLMGHIRDIAVVEGQAVKAGQRLFTVDPIDVEGAVEQARLGLQQAEDARKDAKADYDRFANLYKDEVVTRQNYEKMKLGYEIAVSRAAQAKAGLATATGQLRYATVTAPISGVVTQKLANEGDIAAPGHPVVIVENTAHLQVQTSVDDSVFRSLKQGDRIKVEIDGQAAPLTAKIARISPAADPMTHTYLVKLDVSGTRLHSGAFARVHFATGLRLMLAVPQTALQNRAGIEGVFVIDAQGIAQYRMVRAGAEKAGQVEILSGLSAGDRVVSSKAATVNNGDRIVAAPAVAK